MNSTVAESDARVRKILHEVKKLAVEYKRLTGKPLGVTGEVAEVAAADMLGLRLTEALTDGHDALRANEDGSLTRVQIKGRACKNGVMPRERISRIK